MPLTGEQVWDQTQDLFEKPWRYRQLLVFTRRGEELKYRPGKVVVPQQPERPDGRRRKAGCIRSVLAIATLSLSELVIKLALWIWYQLARIRARVTNLDQRPKRVPDLWVVPPAHLQAALDLKLLKTPADGFSNDVVYAGHPHQPHVYLQVASFHRFLFEQKFTELQFLLECLGATRIAMSHTTKRQKGKKTFLGISWDLGGIESVGLRQVAEQVASQAGGVTGALVEALSQGQLRRKESELATGQIRFVFEATYRPHRVPFSPPADELVWLEHELQWQRLAHSRLNAGLVTFKEKLHYQSDYEVNKSMAIQLANLGLSLGGTFVDYEEIVWDVEGEFAPLSMWGG